MNADVNVNVNVNVTADANVNVNVLNVDLKAVRTNRVDKREIFTDVYRLKIIKLALAIFQVTHCFLDRSFRQSVKRDYSSLKTYTNICQVSLKKCQRHPESYPGLQRPSSTRTDTHLCVRPIQ